MRGITAPIVEWLLQKTRSYIFATAAPPLLACALSESLRLIECEDNRRADLRLRIAQLRQGLTRALHGTAWILGESSTAIQPLLIGPNDQALAVTAEQCRQNSIRVQNADRKRW